MLAIGAAMMVVTMVKLGLVVKTLQEQHKSLAKRFDTYVEAQANRTTVSVAKEKVSNVVIEVQKAPTTEDIKTEVAQTEPKNSEPVVGVESVDEAPVVESKPLQEQPKVISHQAPNPYLRTTAPKTEQTQIDPVDNLIGKIKTYFTTGNPMVKVGGVILFFGLTFLIRFAVSNDMISIEAGLFSVLLFAIVLIVIGWRFKARQGDFGLILQGLGIAIFYLAIFSGAKFFAVIPFSLALAAMVLTVIFATILAVVQDAFYLAIFATVGGFLAPILTATGEGSHVILFSYYTFLNLSIIAIAWFKAWRLLNLIGFGFTFIIGTAWGVSSYQSENFATTEPFLILFFLMYVAVAILFAHRTTFKLKAYVDTALVFGVPSVGFGLQAAIAQEYEYMLAFSALAVSGLYLSLAWWLRKKEKFSLLSESFLALGVVFLSLVFAFAFSPEVSSVIFALESSAIIWISLRQNRLYARLFALALEAYAIISFVNQMKYTDSELFLNTIYLGFSILALATLSSSFIYARYKTACKPFEHLFSKGLLVIGLLLWFVAGFNEVKHYEYAYFLVYFSLSTLGLMVVALRTQWQELSTALELFMPLGILSMTVALIQEQHPFVDHNYIALPLYFVVYYLLLARMKFSFSHYWHAIGLWAILLLLSLELSYQLQDLSNTIALSVVALLPILSIYIILNKATFWPLTTERNTYQNLGISGIVIALMIWELGSFVDSAVLTNFVYIPVLNPLELMQLSVIITTLIWMRKTETSKTIQLRFSAFWVLAFSTLFLARLVHYYGGVSYNIVSLGASNLFQTALSIMYTFMALAIIVYAKKRASRTVWIAGAALQGVVIVKLLLIDMARSGSLERIISFLVVGVLILVIGFIAPLPPKTSEKHEEEIEEALQEKTV